MSAANVLSQRRRFASRLPGGGRRGGARAFTLIEAMVASVVVAIAVLGVCGALATTYDVTAGSRETANATALARQLLDEIVAKPLADPYTGSVALGPDAAETSRDKFNNVTDYAGYTDATTAIPLAVQLASGPPQTVSTGGDLYRRSVTVTPGVKPNCDTSAPATNADWALVTVTVTPPSGRAVVVSKLVTNYPVLR